jgi:hypothetical protein
MPYQEQMARQQQMSCQQRKWCQKRNPGRGEGLMGKSWLHFFPF